MARAWFCARYGLPPETRIYGLYSGRLSNEDDTLRLMVPDNPQPPEWSVPGFVPYVCVEEIHYYSHTPWPDTAMETGLSLGRINAWGFGNDPANWRTGNPSPALANPGCSLPDLDQDGLPDEWEFANGLDMASATGAQGAAADPDNDGFSNYQEYHAGTNPLDANDYPRLTAATVVGAELRITFDSRAGRVYSLERKFVDDSGTNQWTAIVQDLPGDGTTRTISDTAENGAARLYRLKIGLAP